MERPLAIEVEHVYFSYDKVPVLEDVTFSLAQGEFLAILGPNGGGKTTLLKLMLGLLTPQKGNIKILGKPPTQARSLVSYLPQHTDFNLSFPITAYEVAIMGRLARRRPGRPYSREDHKKAQQVLELVGMWDYRYSLVNHLSGGQRQRIFIARALASDPAILFLDEPTASVDPQFGIDLYDLLNKLNETITIVVITHDIGVISRHIKSVACINRSLTFHEEGKITQEMLDMAYQCPVDLVAHGVPHRVFPKHEERD